MDQRKELEERAEKLGVALTPRPAPAAWSGERAQMPKWLEKVMPSGAQVLGELKAQLDPETWGAIAENLRRGAGYVVDLRTRIAIGSPPVDEWERGRVESVDGFLVKRVRVKPQVWGPTCAWPPAEGPAPLPASRR